MKFFTHAQVRGLKARAKRYDLFEGREGFGVRVFPSGNISWVYRYTSPLTGQRRRMTLGTFESVSLADAREAHAKARKATLAGKDPAADKIGADTAMREVSTVKELADAYLDHAKTAKRTWKEDKRLLEHDLLPVLGKYRITDITRRQINLVLDRPKARESKIVENRLFAAIRGMFRWAVQQGMLDRTPTDGMKMRNRENERDRRVEGENLKDFWNAVDALDCTPGVRIAIKLLLTTGQRRGEIVSMKESDIRGDLWTISQTKNGKPHKVPLSQPALNLIRQAKALNGGSDHLFPSPRNDGPLHPDALTRAMARDKLGISPHDLRRTTATEMAALGIAPHVISEVLNHIRQGVTLKHYARHDFMAEKRDALDRWAERLEAAIPELALPENVVAISGGPKRPHPKAG